LWKKARIRFPSRRFPESIVELRHHWLHTAVPLLQREERLRADLQKELNRTGIPVEQVLARYHLDDISQMKPEHYRDAMSGLKKSKPIVAA
jgi:hypothetical protein